jgi:hypothetical protein
MGLALSAGGTGSCGSGLAAAPTRGGGSGPSATFRMFSANRFSVRGESEADQVGAQLSVASVLGRVCSLGVIAAMAVVGWGQLGGATDACARAGVRASVHMHFARGYLGGCALEACMS